MSGLIAHAGGLDEMAMLLFPVFVGFGVWILTRQPNKGEKKSGAGPVEPVEPDSERQHQT